MTNHTKQFRIHWLSLDQPPNVYKIDYIDHTEIETILTNVSMDKIAKDTFRLPHVEKTRTEKVLRKAIKAELGEPVEDEEEEEEEEEAQDETGKKSSTWGVLSHEDSFDIDYFQSSTNLVV